MSLILQRLGKGSLGMAPKNKHGLLALSDSMKVVIAKRYCRGLQLVSGKTELTIFRDVLVEILAKVAAVNIIGL